MGDLKDIQSFCSADLSQSNQYYPFVNEPLKYGFDELEPYIDTKTMNLHYERHLQGYINNLNKVVEENAFLKKYSLKEMIQNTCNLPPNVQADVAHNAGGVYNHRFFFNGLSPDALHKPEGKLMYAINECFDNFETFKQYFTKVALDVFGSGYAWLVRCKNSSRLMVISTANQDSPLLYDLVPVVCIDVWEHAYYLKHYNDRKSYINDWFNVVDWRIIY